MSTRNLDKMMVPRSVVAIGASARPGSVGAAVTRNLLTGGFKGDIHLVNLKGGTIEGRPVLKSLAELREPDCVKSPENGSQPGRHHVMFVGRFRPQVPFVDVDDGNCRE